MVKTRVQVGALNLQNPILTASGTYGYGNEYRPFVNLNCLGGIVVKGTTLHPREGNPYPRMAETPAGMLNAVGLQNQGVCHFLEHIYPTLQDLKACEVIVNVNGPTIEDIARCAQILAPIEGMNAIELNISCPNVKEGGMAFGVSARGAAQVVKAVRAVYPKTLIVKLSPNVTDVTEIARAVEDEGADAVSLINTLLGMAIDYKRRKPLLSTVTGGLSGPCVKPIALRMVWQVAQAVKIPVIGMGGITSLPDVIEFLLAGATAVQVGTYNFVNPAIAEQLVVELEQYLEQENIADVNQLIGALEV